MKPSLEITKEKFYELKQLDRIEYRQIEQNILKEYDNNAFISYVTNYVPLAITFLMVVSIFLGLLTGRAQFLHFVSVIFPIAITIIFITMFICFIGDLISSYQKNKLLKELDAKYFKIEVKK